jgi:outer membrane biosynthesis protein TonB
VVLGAATSSSGVGLGAGVGAGARSGRQMKLIGGAVALVAILCGIVAVAVLRKPSTPAVAAPPPQPVQPSFSDLAKAAQEEADRAKAAAPVVAPPPVAPAVAPPKVETKEVVTKAGKGKGAHGKRGAGSPTSPTSPPPVGMTAEQAQAASRFAESSGRDVRAATSATPSARSTPAQADISRVINNNRQGIQTCYQRALLRDSTLTQGKVTVRVSIGLSGKVKSVSLDAPLPFRSMEPCVRDVMSRWAFPPSSEEYGTEFPVVLQGNQ